MPTRRFRKDFSTPLKLWRRMHRVVAGVCGMLYSREGSLMNPNQFTHKLQEALQAAQSIAASKNHSELSGTHLFSALLAQEDGATRPILEKAGGRTAAMEGALRRMLDKL